MWVAPDYVWTYLAFAALGIEVCVLANRFVRPVFYVIIGSLLIAMPNVSSWRGYIEVETLRLYAVCIFALYAPLALLQEKARLAPGRIRITSLGAAVIAGHLAIVYGVVAYLYATRGDIILEQDLRYGVPPALEYTAKSALALAAFAPYFIRSWRRQLLFVAAVVLPAVLIGSRGTALVAILSFALCKTYVDAFRTPRLIVSKKAMLVGLVAVGTAVIFTGFYLRRRAGAELASAATIAASYFNTDSWWVYAFMPLHLGFRETVGITNRIVTDHVRNELSDVPLFFADLYTVFPGEQLSSGQALSQLFGVSEAGGLTPGLVGGLYIDYQGGCVFFFLAFGCLIAWFLRQACFRARYVPLFAALVTQFLHLFHRGLLKPEYFTVMVITAVYASLARVERTPAEREPRLSGARQPMSALLAPHGTSAT